MIDQWCSWIASSFPLRTVLILATILVCLCLGGDQVHKQYEKATNAVSEMAAPLKTGEDIKVDVPKKLQAVQEVGQDTGRLMLI